MLALCRAPVFTDQRFSGYSANVQPWFPQTFVLPCSHRLCLRFARHQAAAWEAGAPLLLACPRSAAQAGDAPASARARSGPLPGARRPPSLPPAPRGRTGTGEGPRTACPCVRRAVCRDCGDAARPAPRAERPRSRRTAGRGRVWDLPLPLLSSPPDTAASTAVAPGGPSLAVPTLSPDPVPRLQAPPTAAPCLQTELGIPLVLPWAPLISAQPGRGGALPWGRSRKVGVSAVLCRL